MPKQSKDKGFVYLVGAGPGDPDLLTLKGKKALEHADIILYDRLISSSILSYAQPHCDCIFVGKYPDKQHMSQREINDLLVEMAQEGNTVVRLKGGDPFVFGRGGEEALVLQERGISYEIIPGVTSAIAAPAYAGIPVTHRGLSSSFMVITGHEAPQKNKSMVAWEHLSLINGTLVFLMGMDNLPLITENLIKNGMDVSTPVAIVEKGTSSEQRTVCGDLRTIVSLAQQHQLENPAVIVVGEVVKLRDELRWFEKRPLFGRRVLVTRARKQASTLSAALAKLGAYTCEVPAIALRAPTYPEHLSAAVAELGSYDWVVFTSANGVEAFFIELYAQGFDARQLAGLEIVAIGSATQSALKKEGIRDVLVPKDYYAEGIIEEMRKRIQPGERVLLARAEEAREVLPVQLAEIGALVAEVAVYKTVATEVDTEPLITALNAQEFDAITFTSSSTVHNFMRMIGGDTTLLSEVNLFSIGPITSDTIREYGLEPTVQARRYCIEGLVEALVEYSKRQES